MIVQLVWVLLSFRILQYFKKNRELRTDVYNEGETSIAFFIEASLWQRFLHAVLDIIIAIMLFSPFIQLIIMRFGTTSFFGGPDYNSIPQSLLVLIIIGGRIIYYLLFEGILGSTPAKFFTGTRVIDYDGNQPYFGNIAGRTFLRLVPFEAISFFTGRGLHDKASKTMVAKET